MFCFNYNWSLIYTIHTKQTILEKTLLIVQMLKIKDLRRQCLT